jgi:crossover junction endodeoxyribonuclease RusA
MPTLELTLPYPPSVNTYWGFHGHRRFLTDKAVDFKKAVAHWVSLSGQKFGNARLKVTIITHAPDRRARDIDNIVKPTLDALVQAGLFNDDSQVDMLTVKRGHVVKGGKAMVYVGVVEV